MPRARRARWIALALLALGLVAPAASALEAPAACCPQLADAERPCQGLVAVPCCEAAASLAGRTPAPGARAPLALGAHDGESPAPLLLRRGLRGPGAPAARAGLAFGVLRL
jgi:hypothetical protein